eukprot:3045230-Rhodomonas_salina.3
MDACHQNTRILHGANTKHTHTRRGWARTIRISPLESFSTFSPFLSPSVFTPNNLPPTASAAPSSLPRPFAPRVFFPSDDDTLSLTQSLSLSLTPTANTSHPHPHSHKVNTTDTNTRKKASKHAKRDGSGAYLRSKKKLISRSE